MTGVTAGRPPLYTGADKRTAGVLLVAAAITIGLSWFFAAGRSDAGDQLVFVSLALAGALLGISATAGLVLRGRRRVGVRRRLLLGTAPAAPADTPRSEDLVAGPDAHWFHRADCLLVEGRRWPAAPLSSHLGVGREACRACRPGLTSGGERE